MRIPLDLTELTRCPDCDSDVGELVEESPGLFVLEVAHDPTCPLWQRMQDRD